MVDQVKVVSSQLQVIYTELFFLSRLYLLVLSVYMIRYSDNSFVSLCEIIC